MGRRGHLRAGVQPGDLADLAGLHQGQHRPGGTGSRRTAGAVQVVLVVVRRVEVDNQVDVIDVQPAGGDIGGDQNPGVPGGEAVQYPLALVLVEVAVDRGGIHTGPGQLAGQPVGPVLCAHEEQRPTGTDRDLGGERDLVHGGHHKDAVVGVLDRRGGGRDRVDGRVGQEAADQPVDPAVEGGGEQQPLSAGRSLAEQARHGGQEAQVGQVIRLVEHGDLDPVERARTAFDQVDQAAGRRDDHVDPAPDLGDLLADRHPAVDGRDRQAHRVAERPEHGGDLVGQLTGGDQDEGAGCAGGPVGRTAAAGGQPRQYRKSEREGLPGSGLGPAEDVPAGQRVGHRPSLDGERRGYAAAAERGDERGGQAELLEGLGGGLRYLLCGGQRTLQFGLFRAPGRGVGRAAGGPVRGPARCRGSSRAACSRTRTASCRRHE